MIDTHEALIFDCDGVLVNSELIAQEIELAMLESVGVRYSREEYVRMYSGTSESDFIAGLRADASDQLGVELSESFFEDLFVAIGEGYEQRLDQIEGVQAVIAAWPKLKAVASSSEASTLTFKLRKVGLVELFGSHIYSAEMVGRGKPHPDVFLHASSVLGVETGRCLVVEDSVNGIVAAKAAGMTAIGFTGGGHCLEGHGQVLFDAGADYVVSTHNQLGALLRG